MLVAIAGVAVAAGVMAVLVWWLIVPRLPVADDAPQYADLVTVPHGLIVAGVCVLVAAIGAPLVAPAMWPAWVSLCAVAAVGAAIDELTTWIPAVLCWVGTGLTWALTVGAMLWGGVGAEVVAVVAGGALAGLFFWLLWLCRVQMGFGDVRFVVLIGSAGALIGDWAGSYLAVLAGAVLGVARALIERLCRRRDPGELMPWALTLLAGVVVAAAWFYASA